MAILLKESKFTDLYGNITNQFKANAGDSITIEHTFESEISTLTTSTNKFRIDKLENKLTRTEGSFLIDGFREGQAYSLILVNNTNGIQSNWIGTILTVSDLSMTMTGLPNLNQDITDYLGIIIGGGNYDSLNFAFNFVDNDVPKDSSASLESFIDQETSRFNVDGLISLAVNSSLPLVQVGKKSGQFSIESASITRLADITNPYTAFTSSRRQYKLSLKVIFSGMFTPDSFIGSKCLKYFSRASFKIYSTENLAPTIIEFNQDANTGLWNEGFNQDQANSTFSTTIDSVFYNKINTFSISTSCPTSLNITELELGAMYYSLEDDFNKNKQEPQDFFLPFLKSGKIGVANIGEDWVSSTTYPFNILLDNFTYADAGGVRTFNLQFTLNPFFNNPNGFGKFVEQKGELDRQFYIWLKVGNTNRLLFDGMLQFELPVGVAFTPSSANLINHDNNIDYKVLTNANNLNNVDFNIEDDVAHVSEFSLFSADENQSVNAKVVVRNISTNYEFVLDRVSFDLTDIDLQFFINQSVFITNNLPDSSRKKEAFLIQKSPLSGNEMEVRLYYPFIYDWKYWEEVLTTHPYFVSKNKNNSNWLNYKDLPWNLFIKIEIQRNGVVDYYYEPINFLNYDEWDGNSIIELFDATESTQYKSLQENMTMMIKATHIFPSNYGGNPWGMITIEPSESSPRYILSTEIDRTQSDNPLVGISIAERCDMQYFSSDTIILRCFVNTNLLDGNNFCISSKISEDGQQNNNPEENKLTEDSQDKITEDETNVKIVE